MYEELEPIDRNLQYDFNYQQITHLKREVVIKPVSVVYLCAGIIISWTHLYYVQGDVVQLKCFYGTEGVDGVTLVS